MKVLFLSSRLPFPPNRGDRLRTYHFLRNMAKEHSITLVSFIENEKEIELTENLTSFCDEIHTIKLSFIDSLLAVVLNFWKKLPLQALYYRSAKMEKFINTLLSDNDFDVIYIHLFRMAQFMWNRTDLYRIVDLTDIISNEIVLAQQFRKGLSKTIYSIEYKRIVNYEKELVKNFNEIWLISSAESEELSQDGYREKIKVVTNGVDLDIFYPLECEREENSLLFVGHMGVFHNTNSAEYLAKEIFPLVLNEIPNSKLIFAGAEADKTLKALDELPNVEVKGYVDDLNLLLNQVSVFVAPLRFSAGVQNKVLEAMAATTPVVTTSLVNKGLNAHPERDLLIGDSPHELAQQIIKLFTNNELSTKIGKTGRDFVATHFSWNGVNNRLKEIKS